MQEVRGWCACALAMLLLLSMAGDVSGAGPKGTPAAAVTGPARPNLIIILADDLAYADLQAYGGEIETTHIKQLADEGALFTNFRTSAMCSPSRAMLLTGVNQHRTGFASMAEFLTENQRGRPGYEGYLSSRVATIATILRDAGYHTYMAGKWHLGAQTKPSDRGFEHSFALMEGAADHFSDRGYSSANPKVHFFKDGQPAQLPGKFFSSDFYAAQMIDYIKAMQPDGKPFFGYLAFTAPHFPIQAPDDYIAKHLHDYDAGWDVLRRQRFESLKVHGVIPQDAQFPPRNPLVPAWSTLSAQEQAYQAKKMAVYAAAVDAMDDNVGKVLEFLERSGAARNTIVVFLSDNGPEFVDFAQGIDFPPATDWIRKNLDNSYASLGTRNSFPAYGAPWANAGAAAHRYFKTFMTEGGIRGPLIIRYPGVVAPHTRIVGPATIQDITPTLLDAARVRHPASAANHLYPVDGISLLPALRGGALPMRGIAYELFDRRAFVRGHWKILSMRTPEGTGSWQLFDLAHDPGELHDLSAREVNVVAQLKSEYDRYGHDYGVEPVAAGWKYLAWPPATVAPPATTPLAPVVPAALAD